MKRKILENKKGLRMVVTAAVMAAVLIGAAAIPGTDAQAAQSSTAGISSASDLSVKASAWKTTKIVKTKKMKVGKTKTIKNAATKPKIKQDKKVIKVKVKKVGKNSYTYIIKAKKTGKAVLTYKKKNGVKVKITFKVTKAVTKKASSSAADDDATTVEDVVISSFTAETETGTDAEGVDLDWEIECGKDYDGFYIEFWRKTVDGDWELIGDSLAAAWEADESGARVIDYVDDSVTDLENSEYYYYKARIRHSSSGETEYGEFTDAVQTHGHTWDAVYGLVKKVVRERHIICLCGVDWGVSSNDTLETYFNAMKDGTHTYCGQYFFRWVDAEYDTWSCTCGAYK